MYQELVLKTDLQESRKIGKHKTSRDDRERPLTAVSFPAFIPALRKRRAAGRDRLSGALSGACTGNEPRPHVSVLFSVFCTRAAEAHFSLFFSLLCRETAAVEFSLLCRQNRGAAFRCSFRCLHRKRAVGRRARRTGSFIRETVFAPTNNPNMEETGSLENPIPSGECNPGLNRAEERSSVQTLLYARHDVTSRRPATLSPPGTTTG